MFLADIVYPIFSSILSKEKRESYSESSNLSRARNNSVSKLFINLLLIRPFSNSVILIKLLNEFDKFNSISEDFDRPKKSFLIEFLSIS